MSLENEWFILAFCVQTIFLLTTINKIERGYITRLMKKICRIKTKHKNVTYPYFRMAQIVLLYFIAPSPFFHASIICLYLDDYLADDDEWKRRFRTAKNKIKWKMKLPQAQPRITNNLNGV